MPQKQVHWLRCRRPGGVCGRDNPVGPPKICHRRAPWGPTSWSAAPLCLSDQFDETNKVLSVLLVSRPQPGDSVWFPMQNWLIMDHRHHHLARGRNQSSRRISHRTVHPEPFLAAKSDPQFRNINRGRTGAGPHSCENPGIVFGRC